MHRRPLSQRSLQPPAQKRPRSPDPFHEPAAAVKRIKAAAPSQEPPRDKARDRKQLERDQQKAEFKEKYTRAFPGFTFYFEDGVLSPAMLEKIDEMIERLGGKVVQFFDTQVSHFISNRPVPPVSTTTTGDKENHPRPLSKGALKSPIKLRGCLVEEPEFSHGIDPLITAVNLDKKVWNTAKLESVLTRLLDSPTPSAISRTTATLKKPTPTLARLLKSEQIHGTTERDPTQKRHDFKYFSRGSKFILVEDIRQEYATIAVFEYPVVKSREGIPSKTPWPVLHCHPQSRGPFYPFDEKEKKRWEKLQKAEVEKAQKEPKVRTKPLDVTRRTAEANLHAKRTGDLRRSASMNNLHRRASLHLSPKEEYFFNDGDVPESANASGFLASGIYMAASGNSVSITSATGTTSTAGYATRNAQLPLALSGRMKQHVVTSLKFPSITADKENKAPSMAPPIVVPGRQPMLRRSKSTNNTFKQPKREEGIKPGYCESCREKFEDFKTHVQSRKHQRFAVNDANFLQLDYVLARVRRRTKKEVYDERLKREEMRKFYCARVAVDDSADDPYSVKDEPQDEILSRIDSTSTVPGIH